MADTRGLVEKESFANRAIRCRPLARRSFSTGGLFNDFRIMT